MMVELRTLPLRVKLADGEAIDSWLFRLAHRNGMPFLQLAPTLGFGDRLRVWHNYALTWQLPESLLRRIETQTGLPPAALETAVLDQFNALGWKPIPGSRYCPACLSETGGRWPIRWQLPYTFVCLAHRCMLAGLCPACQRTPRSRISEWSGLASPTRCTLARHGKPCDADLLAHRPQRLRADDPRLAAQVWVNSRLDHMDATAVTALRDLDALAAWFRQRIDPSELAHLGRATVGAMQEYRDHNHSLKRHQATATLIAAAMACQAIDVITTGDHHDHRRLAPLLRDVYTAYRTGQSPSARGPMILSHKRLTSLSERLQHKVLASIDSQLPVTERLRYRTRTPAPRPPELGATTAGDRARHIPQHLWPDWVIRLRPLRGRADQIAVDIPNALLIPGNPTRNIHATSELSPWRNNTSIFLSQLAQRYPDVLTALCNIAEHLDSCGAPIDYRRRRATFSDIKLSKADWEEVCARADANPGEALRLLHARRHLFHLLTGADLSNRQHPIGFTSSQEYASYLLFQRQMISALRDELHQHAARLLSAAGIDEPVTWSPPAECAAGLRLPGRDPDDIDMAMLHQLILVKGIGPAEAARRLGVSIEHIRYAAQQLHRPAPPYAWNSQPAARKRRSRADELLTTQFFQREHVEAGKDATTLMAETGFSRKMLHRYARDADVKITMRRVSDRIKADRDPCGGRIDPEWLQEQAGTLQRTNTDIAAEVGLSHETIRRYRKNLGIESRRTGTHSDRRYPNLPADIRRAVEGKRGGWQRLRRFEQVTAHHSINTAAAALGHHAQNLNLQIQRLEADLGAELLIRGHRYQPITATERGRRLLDQLRQPDIRELLEELAPPRAHQIRGPYKRKAPNTP
ncbi:TniQ family protein [Micromonospora purpureochromogenes]|uniref:TniQ family protein n=1 Tax=Micromonospora purpureochromogenes TaxID=47872 RepID=UPI00332872E5